MELKEQLFPTNELTRIGDNKIVNELYEGVQSECEISSIMIRQTVKWRENEDPGRGLGLRARHV